MPYTPEQRAAILAEAREHIAWRPEPRDVLADNMREELERRRMPEPEPEPDVCSEDREWSKWTTEPEQIVTRSLADVDNNTLVSAIANEVHEALDDHKAFVADQISQIIAHLVTESVAFINKRADELHAEMVVMKTEIERLHAANASLQAEVARLSAVELADG